MLRALSGACGGQQAPGECLTPQLPRRGLAAHRQALQLGLAEGGLRNVSVDPQNAALEKLLPHATLLAVNEVLAAQNGNLRLLPGGDAPDAAARSAQGVKAGFQMLRGVVACSICVRIRSALLVRALRAAHPSRGLKIAQHGRPIDFDANCSANDRYLLANGCWSPESSATHACVAACSQLA
jgi:hypothetical protein